MRVSDDAEYARVFTYKRLGVLVALLAGSAFAAKVREDVAEAAWYALSLSVGIGAVGALFVWYIQNSKKAREEYERNWRQR